MGSIGAFYRRSEIWIVYFFNPKLPECQQFADQYKKMAEKLYGIVKIASLNCHFEQELCEEFAVYDPPQILIFTENFNEKGEKYVGAMDWNQIANAAARKMQNFVQVVTLPNYDQFIDRNDKYKILYFTDKKQTPAVMKALSKRYLDKLSFGEVRHTDELSQSFGITEYPTLMAVTDGENM